MGSTSFPSLVFSSEPDRQEWNFYNVVDKTNRVKPLPAIQDIGGGGGTDLLMSTPEDGGWVLLRDRDSGELFLFNLASSSSSSHRIIPVPQLDDDRYEFTFSMPYPPSHPNSSLVAVHTSEPYWLQCRPGSGDSKFSRHDFPDDEFYPSIATASYEGKVYVYDDYLMAIDPVSATATRHDHVTIPVPVVGGYSRFGQLVASAAGCGRRLYLVKWYNYYDAHVLHSVQVFELDLPGQAWVRVDDIGDQTFFMGKSCSMACLASINGIKNNRIYFIDETDQDRLCYYDLDYGSLNVHFPCPDNDSTFTLPRWVLLDDQQNCEARDHHTEANPLQGLDLILNGKANPLQGLDLILNGKLVADCSDNIMGAPKTPCLTSLTRTMEFTTWSTLSLRRTADSTCRSSRALSCILREMVGS